MSELDLIPGNTDEAANNTQRLTDSWAAMITPVVEAHKADDGHTTMPYYFDGTSVDAFQIGSGRIETKGSRGTPVNGNPDLTGNQVRFIQNGSGPLWRHRGMGFVSNDPIEMVGDGFSSAIQVEGRGEGGLPSGRHKWSNILFTNWGCAFEALAGYYTDEGEFVSFEGHADNCRVELCDAFNVGALFRSLNQQALNWWFEQCSVNVFEGPDQQIVADIQRGGNVTFNGLVIEHPYTTLFKIRDFSPNNCRLTCRSLYADRMWADNPGSYLELVKFVGSSLGTWGVDIDGFVANFETTFPRNRLYSAPSTLPRKKWNVRLTGEPAF